MAVALPVLERNTDTDEREFTREYRDSFMTAEEQHNSRISENYARLINPESKPRDIIPVQHATEEKFAEAAAVPAENFMSAREIIARKPYLVENARADADIFRADSPVNRKIFGSVEISAAASQTEEEDNEDLRPTQTTIQYKTAGVKRTAEEGKIETRTARLGRTALTKKDKIIIAVALTVIVALFVLVIVNAAVISNLSSDVSMLQTAKTVAETTYEETLAEKTEFLENIEQIVSDFATESGMILG